MTRERRTPTRARLAARPFIHYRNDTVFLLLLSSSSSSSRHPNFFAEQGMWWVFNLFGVAALPIDVLDYTSLLPWTLIGAALLSMLFVGR